ncbi:MAG: hypothetical protein ACXVCN_11355 [Bdellovibrio sp.]
MAKLKSFSLVVVMLSFSILANADYLDINGILMGNDNKVIRVNFASAKSICPKGTRLSTARELAEMSVIYGGKILTPTQVDPTQDYFSVRAIDQDGKFDQFYLYHSNYVAPEGAFPSGAEEIWSSSVWSHDSKGAYAFSTQVGTLWYWSPEYLLAVRCINQ